MSSPFPLSRSGLTSVDANWGGFRKGGLYLLVGDAHAGGTQHLMTTVQAAVEAGEHCLFISARPQEALAELASQIEFDLPRATQSNRVRLLKSPPAKEMAAFGDLGLSKAFRDLIQLAQTHKAGRVVLDDFSSFVQFRVFNAFAGVFRQFVRDAADINTTFVLGLGEPANNASTNLLRFIEGEVSGTFHATTDKDEEYQHTDKGLFLHAKHSFETDLLAAREAADVTIEEIQQETRLATDILKRFEAGLLIGDPSFNAAYLKSFLRSYANAVGLGPKKVEAALEAVQRGTYKGELHPSYAGSAGGVTDEEEPTSPTFDSGHMDADYVAPQDPAFSEEDPLPPDIPDLLPPAIPDANPLPPAIPEVDPLPASKPAGFPILGGTVRRLLNRTKGSVQALAPNRFGSEPRPDM